MGLLKGEALSQSYYRSRKLKAWVARKLKEDGIERILVFSSPMAQYARGIDGGSVRGVIDFVDVDSEKWKQFAEDHSWPMKWIYRREAETLLRFESSVAAEFAASVFVSKNEADLFCRRAPQVAPRVTYMTNGVDTDYFSPHRAYGNPYGPGERALVFTGAMDYWANVDAVSWFAEEVFPSVREREPGASFCIAGARPDPSVRRLARLPGVSVTGSVPDIRPYLAHARAVVVPLRLARGLQNKVLEAMAMARPIIATPAAVAGLTLPESLSSLVTDERQSLAERCAELLRNENGQAVRLGRIAREHVLSHHGWDRHLPKIVELLESTNGLSSIRGKG
jgi:sugar transferase (PEP-CTERM/EpsH1 system associated)